MSNCSSLAGFQDRYEGPLYVRLRLAFEAAIDQGELLPGDALPPERDISEDCGVSRVTVRKAIDQLVEEGRLLRRQGSGTFVASPVKRMDQPLARATTFTEDMARRGMVASSRWLVRGTFLPNSDEMMALGLSANSRVARLHRLRLADDIPMAIEYASLPADILPDPEKVESSLYAHLEARQSRPVRAIHRISAHLLEEAETSLLAVPPGSATLCVQRVAYSPEGRVIEMTRTLYRSDLYDLVAEQTIGPA